MEEREFAQTLWTDWESIRCSSHYGKKGYLLEINWEHGEDFPYLRLNGRVYELVHKYPEDIYLYEMPYLAKMLVYGWGLHGSLRKFVEHPAHSELLDGFLDIVEQF